MTQEHFISVIIPNYNYAHFVGDAIESVMAQTYKNFELIVVDNGSTDKSKQVLEEYGGEYPQQIRLVFQENRGQAGSRNRGILESKGNLIAFLDADDVWMPNKLEEQVKLFIDPDIGLVYSSCYQVNGNLSCEKELKAKYRGYLLTEYAVAGSNAIIIGGESNVMIRRECFERVGNFDEELEQSTGWDLYRRVASCYKVDYVDLPLMKYRIHGKNMHKDKDMHKQIELQVKKMFEDPLSSSIWHLKNKGLAQMHYGRAHACFSSKQYFLFLYYLIKALRLDRTVSKQIIKGLKKRL